MNFRQIFFMTTVVISSALVGCSSEYDPIPANPSPILTASFPLKVLWSGSLSGDESIYSQLMPAAEQDTVYAAGREGEVKAFNLSTGKLIWETSLNHKAFFSHDDAQLSSGITLYANDLLIGSEKGKLYQIDKTNGQLNWQQAVPGELLAKPNRVQNKIATQTTNGFLQIRDAQNGELIWQVAIQSQSLTLRGNAAPIIIRDRVIAGSSNGRLIAYDLMTGDIIWQQRLSQPRGTNEIARLSDVIVTPQVENNIVYAAGYNGYFGAFELNDGNELWRNQLSSTTNFLLDPQHIYVVDDKNQILALSKKDGKQLWIQSDLLNRRLTAPVLWNNHLFVGDFEGFLYEVNPLNGELISKMELDSSGLLSAPITVSDHLIIQTKKGRLMVLGPR